MQALKPPVAFVCHTGDVVEGGSYSKEDGKTRYHLAGYEEMKQELTFAMKDFAEALRLPIFIAVGNHDKHDKGHRAYNEVVLPVLSRQLGATVSRTFYAFRSGNACFVFLDFGARDMAAQRQLAESALRHAAATKGIEHVFVFGHYPLWCVARPGFSTARFSDAILPLLRQHGADAYFCGHTHNTLVSVRDFGGKPVTQIQGVVSGSGHALMPLEERRALLFPPSESRYGWGYLEGSRTGYYVVTVEGPRVTVQFRVPGKGLIREFAWDEPGKVRDVKVPRGTAPILVTDALLKQARSAALHICPWAKDRTEVTISLNGEQAAEATIGPTYCPFWHEQRVAIPKAKLHLLRQASRVGFGNPTKAVFGIASARIEVTLADGRTVRTPVSQRFLFSSSRAQAQAAGNMRGWRMAPADRVHAVSLGVAVGPIDLCFPGPGQ